MTKKFILCFCWLIAGGVHVVFQRHAVTMLQILCYGRGSVCCVQCKCHLAIPSGPLLSDVRDAGRLGGVTNKDNNNGHQLWRSKITDLGKQYLLRNLVGAHCLGGICPWFTVGRDIHVVWHQTVLQSMVLSQVVNAIATCRDLSVLHSLISEMWSSL